MRMQRTEYKAPALEVIELIPEGSILTMSGGSVGIGGWEDAGDDFGGSAE